MLSKKIPFKVVVAVYIGLAVFRLSDPTLRWFTSTTPVKQANSVYNTSVPTDIKIAKLNLDLAISPSVVEGNNWEVYDDRVAWLSSSALPGKGNTILYAHDRIGLFGSLYKLKIGDEIQIYNGNWISYKVSKVERVQPNDVNSILSSQNRLTLYTCEGNFDQKRLVVYAE